MRAPRIGSSEGRARGAFDGSTSLYKQALERLTYEVSHLFGRYFAAKVGRAPPFVENLVDRAIDLVGQLRHRQRASQHLGRRGDGAERVRDAAPGDVGRRTVDRFVEAGPLPMLALGSRPMEPASTEASSLKMSPNMLPVSTTSKLRGLRMRSMAQESTSACLSSTSG